MLSYEKSSALNESLQVNLVQNLDILFLHCKASKFTASKHLHTGRGAVPMFNGSRYFGLRTQPSGDSD